MTQILADRRALYTDLVQTIADLKHHADSAAATLNWRGRVKFTPAYAQELENYLHLLQGQQKALIDLLIAQDTGEAN